jgi:hypothetical protein
LSLTLDRGTFESVMIDPATKTVRVTLSPASEITSSALLRIEQPAKVAGVGTYRTVRALAAERGGVAVPLGTSATVVELIAK